MLDEAMHQGARRPTPRGGAPARANRDEGGVVAAGGTCFLGRYRIVDEIGVGGMACVHLARADGPGGFQKWVAIKRIHRHLADDETFIQMFLDEARIAARISHPNVAQVFDLGKSRGTYWIAMEYLHGEPLREVTRAVEEGAAPPMGSSLAARLVADAAEGLHAAHELRDRDGVLLQVVHRDVTPHNLFLTYDGAVKVVDFGIAKVNGRAASTRTGTLKGKLAYMSPEQVRGKAIDRRTDVFALGVVLWEVSVGRRLFRADSDLETLERVQACQVPLPSTLVPGYPPELERVVMRALAPSPEARYQSARALARALQRHLMQSRALVGAEELGAYVRGTLCERFERRQQHLRWASEVTRTVALMDLDAGEAAEVSLVTCPSELLELVERSTSRSASRSARPLPSFGATATYTTFPRARSGVSISVEDTGGSADDPEADAVTHIMRAVDEVPATASSSAPRPALSPRCGAPAGLAPVPAERFLSPGGPPVRRGRSPHPLGSRDRGGDRRVAAGRVPRPVVAALVAAATTFITVALVTYAAALLVVPWVTPGGLTARVTAPAELSPRALTPRAFAAATGASAPNARVARTRAAPPPPSSLPAVAPVPGRSTPPDPERPAVAPPQQSARSSTRAIDGPAPAVPRGGALSPGAPAAEPGFLTVVCNPACDNVVAAGHSLGPSPVVRAALPPGTHEVSLERSGSAPKTVTVSIVSGTTAAHRVAL